MTTAYTLTTYLGKSYAAFRLADGSDVLISACTRESVPARTRRLARKAIRKAESEARARDRLLEAVALLDSRGE